MQDIKLAVNVCVVAGLIQRSPEWRALPSGNSVTTFNLKVPNESGRADVIRVSWLDAPASVLDLQEGTAVLATGKIRSYWAGRSITDMSCHSIVPLKLTAKVRKHVTSAMVELQEACP